MKLVDLRGLSPDLSSRITDAKEGLVDALLNLTWQRCSGDGPEGEIVFGTKPSLRFVSGFLLPRYEETGQEDETSDIHLSSHGIDCQIAAGARGSVVVNAAFSIYVRALPTWQDLTAPELDLFPNPPLRRDLETVVRDTMKQRLAAAKAEDAQKPPEERRDYRKLQQELYHGVRRADLLGHTEPTHYLWCASQHHKLDPSKPAVNWHTAWRALRDAAALPGLRFHDLRHTVVTRLLEAGEPDHVVESITGHLSRRMLEHYSHIRLSAKKAALDRLGRSLKDTPIKSAK